MAEYSQYKDLNLVMAETTDCLWDKLETIGVRLTELMRMSNASYPLSARSAADDQMDGILFILSKLGIPYTVRWNAEKDRYIAVDIAGKTFYVSGAAEGQSYGTE